MQSRWLLAALLIGAIMTVQDPPILSQVREKYTTLREELVRTKQFPEIHKPVIITGRYTKGIEGDVGYNVNKGFEIFLCLSGSVNSVMHVLLHELCHMTVSEYDHSSKFWKNLEQLKRIASSSGVYEPVRSEKFCGGVISD